MLDEPDAADLAVARGASAVDVPMVISNQASRPMEQLTGIGDRWFQLYWSSSDDLVASLVSRAEASGCEAIVVTLDTWVTGWRPRDLNTGNFPQLRGHVLTNYFADPVFQRLLGKHRTFAVLFIPFFIADNGKITVLQSDAGKKIHTFQRNAVHFFIV